MKILNLNYEIDESGAGGHLQFLHLWKLIFETGKKRKKVVWHPRISEHPLGQAVWQPEGPYSHPSPLPAPYLFQIIVIIMAGGPFWRKKYLCPDNILD